MVRGELEVVVAGEAGGRLGDAGVARRGINLIHGGALGEAPGEGVFTAAGSDD